jgi:serine/threonine-protein kinase
MPPDPDPDAAALPPPIPGLTLESRLGTGAMGEVWRARDGAGRAVAVKLLRPPREDEVDRFTREVDAIAAVEHPNVVRLLDAGRDGERQWLVLELVDGPPLGELLAIGALGPTGLATLLARVARGLAALHAAGLVHRDVKAANILVDAAFEPRLVDFGLATYADGRARLTATDVVVGTPLYLPPEVLRGEAATPKGDVWALGVVLLEGLLRRHPLAGLGWAEASRRIAEAALPSPSGTPPALAAILGSVLQADPDARPGALELADALERAGADAAPATTTAHLPAPTATPGPAPPRPPRALAPRPLAPGARVGPYAIEAPLGAGGVGTVYAARHEQLGIVRALKVVAPGSDAARERFAREGRVLARLPAHDGVVGVHDTGELPDGRAWLALQRVEGATLREAMRAGPLPLERALRLGAEVARALAHVHSHGVAHRDVKPENVLLRAQGGAAVLVDFGLALDTAEDRLTASRLIVGTPLYLAPEQVDATRGRVGPAADVFALGAVLHEALAGAHPLRREVVAAQLVAIVRDPPPRLRRLRPDAPSDLEALLLAMLDKAPERRPAAAEVARALEALAAGGRWTARPRRRALLGGLAALALLGLVAAARILSPEATPGGTPRRSPDVDLAIERADHHRRLAVARGDAAHLASARAALAGVVASDEEDASRLARAARRLDLEAALAAGQAGVALTAAGADDAALAARLDARRGAAAPGAALAARAAGLPRGPARDEVGADAVRATLREGDPPGAADVLEDVEAPALRAALVPAVAAGLADAAATSAARGDGRGAAALLARARALDEAPARAALADAVTRALAGDVIAAANLVDVLDRAWPGCVPRTGAEALAARAAASEVAGDLEAAAADCGRALDVDPTWTLPIAAGFELERRVRVLIQGGERARAARLLVVVLRAGRRLHVTTAVDLFALRGALGDGSPPPDLRAPWAWDLLWALCVAASLERRPASEAERAAEARLALTRLGRVRATEHLPDTTRELVEELALDLHVFGRLDGLVAHAEALLGSTRPRPPDWHVAWRVAEGLFRAGDLDAARPWLDRALAYADDPDADPRRREDVYSLTYEVVVHEEGAGAAALLARPEVGCLAERQLLLRAFVAVEVAVEGGRAEEVLAPLDDLVARRPHDLITRRGVELVRARAARAAEEQR